MIMRISILHPMASEPLSAPRHARLKFVQCIIGSWYPSLPCRFYPRAAALLQDLHLLHPSPVHSH